MLDLSGIYSITSASGRRYIGSAVKLRWRWNAHKSALNNQRHANRHLQNAWNKHGEAGMRFDTVLICRREDLLFYEQMAIDHFKPEYNLSPTAGSSLGITRVGKPHASERCAAISAALKGRVFTKEWRAKLKIANRRKRKPHKPERSQAIRQAVTAYWARRRAAGLPLRHPRKEG